MLPSVSSSNFPPLYDTNLGPNDVLLGRGAPFLNYQGNKRFRDHVKTLRANYISSGRNRTKNEIAKQVIQEIARRGGRFLVCVTDESIRNRLHVPQGTRLWKVADEEVVMEKCKQALRDKDPPTTSSSSSQSAVQQQLHDLSSGASTATTTKASSAASVLDVPSPAAAGSMHQQSTQQDSTNMFSNVVLPQQQSQDVPNQSSHQTPILDAASLLGLTGALGARFPAAASMPTTAMNSSASPQGFPAQFSHTAQSFPVAAWQELRRKQEQAQQLQALGQYLLSTGQQMQAALMSNNNDPSQVMAAPPQMLGGQDPQQLLLQLLLQQQHQVPNMGLPYPTTTAAAGTTETNTEPHITPTQASTEPPSPPPQKCQELSPPPQQDELRKETFGTVENAPVDMFSSNDLKDILGTSSTSSRESWAHAQGGVSEFTMSSDSARKQVTTSSDSDSADAPNRKRPHSGSDGSELEQEKRQNNCTHSSSDGDVSSN